MCYAILRCSCFSVSGACVLKKRKEKRNDKISSVEDKLLLLLLLSRSIHLRPFSAESRPSGKQKSLERKLEVKCQIKISSSDVKVLCVLNL